MELLAKDPPLAGGASTVNLCINNRGYVDMDVVVARNGGESPGDIYLSILNEEGLEVSRSYYQGAPAGTLVSGGTWFVRVEKGGVLCVDVNIVVPAGLEDGYQLRFAGGVEGISHGIGGDVLAGAQPLVGTMVSNVILSSYYGTAQAEQTTYTGDETVVITGQAINRSGGLPEPEVPLKLGFFVRGFKWYEDVSTDEDGNFSFNYQPTAGLSGEFVIWAAHPDVVDTLDQDRFDLYRLYTKPSYGRMHAGKAESLDFQIQLHNPGDQTLTGFTGSFYAYTIDASDNKTEETKVHGQVNFAAGYTLKPGETRLVDLHFSAELDAPDSVNLEYTFTSTEGASDKLLVEASLREAVPVLSVELPATGYVDVSVTTDNITSVPVTIRNTGLQVFDQAVITLPADVPWMTVGLPLNSQGKAVLGDIGVGESVTFDVVFVPPLGTAMGYHNDQLVLSAANTAQTFNVALWAKVTSGKKGDVLFKVVNFIGQEVDGASVRLQNIVLNEQAGPFTTDDQGEVTVTSLTEGDWSYRVTAAGHKTSGGVVSVKPDQVVLEEVFPTKNLVTVSFVVEPVPFTDRYEIKIEQTFETHVPVPVLVVDPPKFNFEDVASGFQTEVVVTATNHGLIKLEDLQIEPAQVGGGRIEPLISYVPELGPFQSIRIPCRVTYEDPGVALPGGSAEEADKIDWLDCELGGFKDIAKGLVNLQTILKGRGYCRYTSQEEAEHLTNTASAFLVWIHLWNSKDTFTGGEGFIGNVKNCVGQRLWEAIVGDSLKKLLEKTEQTETKPTWEKEEGLFGVGGEPGNGTGGPEGEGPKSLTSWEEIVKAACFAEGTPILMADGGQQPIESLTRGDRVMGPDGVPATVSRTTVRESDHWREIRYRALGQNGGDSGLLRLRTTDEHQFWVAGKEWVSAGRIAAGDTLVLSGGELGEVVSTQRFDESVKVYNFDVEGVRSYFANGALVFQECGSAGKEHPVTVWLRGILRSGSKNPAVVARPPGAASKERVPRAVSGIEVENQRRPL